MLVTVNTDNNKTIKLHKNNPYIKLQYSLLNNPADLYISKESVQYALLLDKRYIIVNLVCAFDFILSFYYYYINVIAGLFLSIFSLLGYASTVMFHKSTLFLYLNYQYMQVVIRGFSFIVYLSTYNDTHKVVVLANTGNEVCNVLLLIFLFISQIFITFFIQEYYYALPNARRHTYINFHV